MRRPSHLYFITYRPTYKNGKNWVKLQLIFCVSSTLSFVYCVSVRFVVLTAAFLRIQVVYVDAVPLREWFLTFRKVGNHSPNYAAYYDRKSGSSFYS
jgi:hypothetical protein